MPAGLDIAGDLVIYSIEYPGGHPMYRLEEISLLRWTDGVPLDLPPVSTAMHIYYLRTKELQVTSFYSASNV